MRLIKVAVMFVVSYAVLQTGVWLVGYFGWLDEVLLVTATATGACANLTGVPATVVGNQVFLASRTLQIDPQCTGVSLAMLYAALVLAYPLGLRHKLIGLAVGLPALILTNMLRLTAVAQLSGPLDDEAFLFVHDYLFMIVMMGAVIAFWVAYLEWARRSAV